MNEQRSGIKVTASDALEFEPVAPKIKKAGSALKTVAFVVVAVSVGAVGWAMYGERLRSMIGGDDADVPVVRAELGPLKVRPASPGGLQVPDRDKLVYNRIQNGTSPPGAAPSVERLLPPPETPLPGPSSSGVKIEPSSGGASTLVTPRPSGSESGSALATPPSKPKRINETPRVADVTRAEKPMPAPPAPDTGDKASAAAVAAPEKPASSREVTTSSVRAATSTSRAASTPAPDEKSKSKPLTAAPSPASVDPSKAYKVQLAAARTPAAARGEWDKLRRKHLDLLGDLGLSVTKVDLGATRGIFYRLRVGPLNNEKEARALCKALAKRKVSCLIVRPGK